MKIFSCIPSGCNVPCGGGKQPRCSHHAGTDTQAEGEGRGGVQGEGQSMSEGCTHRVSNVMSLLKNKSDAMNFVRDSKKF